MRAPISIVILQTGSAADFAASLASLGPGLEEGLIAEVILQAPALPTDWAALADQAGVDVVQSPAGRPLVGRWLVRIAAGTQLAAPWPGLALAHLQAGGDGPLPLPVVSGPNADMARVKPE